LKRSTVGMPNAETGTTEQTHRSIARSVTITFKEDGFKHDVKDNTESIYIVLISNQLPLPITFDR